jgi:hypothetical protein
MYSKDAETASHDQPDEHPPPPYEAIPQNLSEAQGISVNGALPQLITRLYLGKANLTCYR